jgi:hypothetical protein
LGRELGAPRALESRTATASVDDVQGRAGPVRRESAELVLGRRGVVVAELGVLAVVADLTLGGGGRRARGRGGRGPDA